MTNPVMSVAIEAKLDNFEATLNKAVSQAKSSSGKIESAFIGIGDSFKSLGGTIAAAFSVGAVISFAQSLSAAQQVADKLRNSLAYSSGSSSGAVAELGYLRDVTSKLGLDFVSTAQAYAKFSAATKTSGITASDTKVVFEGISAAATKMGLSADETGGALLALSQMASKGTVQSEELRGQLAERLPGAFAVAAKAVGVTTVELGKMLESGQVLASDFLPKFGRALKDEFGGSVNSLTQEINRLNSAWDIWKMTLSNSDGGGFQWLTNGINESSAAMRALGRDAGVTHKLLAAIGGFEMGAFGGGKFDTAKAQEQAMSKLYEIKSQRQPLEEKDYRTPFEQQTLRDLKRQEQETRDEINALAVRRGSETGFKAPDLAGEYAANINKQNERLKAYQSDTSNEPKAVKIAALVEKENKAFEAAVAGLSVTDTRYVSALKSHNARVAEITKPEKEKKVAVDNSYDILIKSINEKIAVQSQEDQVQRSLTEGEKLSAKVASDLTDGTLELTAAQKASVATKLEELVILDKRNAARKGEAESMQYLADIQKKYDRDNEAKRDALSNLPEGVARLNAELRKVDETADAGNVKLAKMLGDGKLNAETFAAKMSELTAISDRQKDSILALNAAQDQLNASWETGADRALQIYSDKAKNVADESQAAFLNAFQGIEDALVTFASTGKLSFSSLATSIVADLARIQIRAAMTPALTGVNDWIKGMFGSNSSHDTNVNSMMQEAGNELALLKSANGNVFSGSPSLHQYANTVQTSAKVFQFGKLHGFASGGVFAEAGPEAVMPLARDSSGRLGVKAQGGGNGGVSIIVNNTMSDKAEATAKPRMNNGKLEIEVLIQQVLSKDMRSNGSITQGFAGTFGLARAT